ncbi:copper chaperone PCu(A)C [Spiribacter roseus]|uniref:copper chaperone PCu(A)C n=1 Tax=Spiribacter roseus TaxID=1855875 RepID=UPI001330D63C|nr:copper chaperone PCu(A)C [Spiribacter roseus]KAF0284546.1 hypothetical protein BA898_09560 [Spiribacter roseus]
MHRTALHRFAWLTTALIGTALAGTAQAELIIEDAWARATPPGFSKGAVYLEIRNDSRRSDTLVGVHTERAGRAELHRTIEEGGNSRMVHTPRVRVPAEGSVTFEPGGRHVMMMGIDEALTEGERFSLELEAETAGTLRVNVEVLAPTAMGVD